MEGKPCPNSYRCWIKTITLRDFEDEDHFGIRFTTIPINAVQPCVFLD